METGDLAWISATGSPPYIPKHINSPASDGGEDPRRDVSGGVDGVTAVAAQRNPNEHNQETHSDGFAARWGRFVLLVGQSHYAEQKHAGPKHLVAQTPPVNNRWLRQSPILLDFWATWSINPPNRERYGAG